MKAFIKINAASVSASGWDYLVIIILVNFLKIDPLAGGITGTVAEDIVSFLMGRYWVFKDNKAAISL